MERLTKVMQCDDGNKLYDYSNEVIRNVKDFSSRLELMFQKLAEYEDLEEQGLLLKTKCKPGDSLYKPNPITLKEIVEIRIESIFIAESGINISGRTTKMKYSFCCSPSDIGKTVFLTKTEAEQKLKEMESDSL